MSQLKNVINYKPTWSEFCTSYLLYFVYCIYLKDVVGDRVLLFNNKLSKTCFLQTE